MTLTNFDEAVAVITGGASGIGLATARALYSKGAHVVLADLNEQGLQTAKQQIQESNPSSTAHILTIVVDVSDEEWVQSLMREALNTCGRIDLVVTCAGIGWGGTIDTFSGSKMQKTMNVNFMGTYHSIRAALPTMRQQGSGHFVLLSSVAGKVAPPLLSAYVATKWAVRGLSLALEAEFYGTGIGITTVYPAWVDTPLIHQEELNNFPIEALLTPEQVADEIVQAIQEDRSDLTLVPNPDIAYVLHLMHEDPAKAIQLTGKAYRQRTQQNERKTQ